MAILDLQGMQSASERSTAKRSNRSRGCPPGTSTLSLLLC
jgi:hypothetical protein